MHLFRTCLRLRTCQRHLHFLFFVYIAVFKADIQTGVYQQRQSKKQEEQLERRIIGHLHTLEVVANQITGTQQQVANGTEYAPAAQAPYIQEQEEGIFEGIAAYFEGLSASGTEITPVVHTAVGTLVLLCGKGFHLMGPLLPLPKALVSIYQFLHFYTYHESNNTIHPPNLQNFHIFGQTLTQQL